MSPRNRATGAATPATKGVVWTIVCAQFLFGFGHAVAAEPPAESEKTPSPEASSPSSSTNGGPMGPEAKAHYDRGLNLYAAHQYTAAVAELRLGFAVEPRREFLFAEAQALRLAGECGQAITLYQQFIDTAPPPLQLQAARLGVDRCGPERARAASPPPVAVAPAPAPPPREITPWWRDSWGDLSVGAGVVALGVAAGFEIASRRAQDQARAAETYAANDQAWARADQRRVVAVSALVGGLVLVAVGGVRLLMVRGRETADTAATAPPLLSVAITEQAASLLWQGAF